MTDQEDREFFKQQALEGSREAAGWALRMVDGFENAGSVQAALELYDQLGGMTAEKRSVILVQLANLVGRLAVDSPDMATLKVKLRALQD